MATSMTSAPVFEEESIDFQRPNGAFDALYRRGGMWFLRSAGLHHAEWRPRRCRARCA